MSLPRSFLYRFPRFSTRCSMDLVYGDTVVLGTCLDVSESGLRGTFSHPVVPGTQGILTLYHADRSVQVNVLVDGLRGTETGVRFRFDVQDTRLELHAFLTSLRSDTPEVD